MTAVPEAPVCATDPAGCITCGDVAVPLTVLDVVDGGNADCRDDDGAVERVATDLVGDVVIGDWLLVHARVAIAHLGPMTQGVTA